ncbi:MAG: hypothetical protein HIU91_11675 [Acidobacteria bacterium]|nr:hypothetical protein [Acidobacteriota bacterium]
MSFCDFKFDHSSGDLLRGEKRLRIPKQTSQLLAILLEHPGTVVTRAQLQHTLWPDGEFLDHEHAIIRVIRDLRAILRDNPKSPKFIETVHKRGYRFLPEVDTTPATTPPLEAPSSPHEHSTPQQPKHSPPQEEASATEPASLTSRFLPDTQQHQTTTILPQQSTSKRFLELNHWILGATLLCLITVALAMESLRHRHNSAVAPESSPVSLGIAPFQSDGPGAAEMGESFRLDLTDALAQLPIIQIRATNSLNTMSRDDSSIRSISGKLNLDMLLLGTFHLRKNHLTAQFELIRGRDSLHLASFQYEGTPNELADIRDKLQRDIFLSLQGKGRSMQSIRGSTNDPLAYGEYLQGRELTRLRDPIYLNQALAHYQSAIQRDPNFAQAYAGMAADHLALRYFADPVKHQNAAKQLAQHALQLDPELAEAHAVLGDVALRGAWNFALSETELRRAIELDPSKSTYHAWLASLMVNEGRFHEGLSEINLAIADDPLWPAVYSMGTYVAGMARKYDTAMVYAQKAVSLTPDSPSSHNQLAWAYFTAKTVQGSRG